MSKVMLLSFAHPDDESFVAGGTIPKYVGLGWDIYLICATKGEAGKSGNPPRCDKKDLGKCREEELLKAAKVLGIKEVFFLGYLDGRTSDIPVEEGIDKVFGYIKALKPQAVLTFGPDGISEHPDHKNISLWTTVAFERFKEIEPNTKLFYATIPSNPQGPLGTAASKNVKPVTVIIDTSKESLVKAKALKCHETQHLSIDKVFFSQPPKVLKALLEKEYYYHYWPQWKKAEAARDLFEEG